MQLLKSYSVNNKFPPKMRQELHVLLLLLEPDHINGSFHGSLQLLLNPNSHRLIGMVQVTCLAGSCEFFFAKLRNDLPYAYITLSEHETLAHVVKTFKIFL